MLTIQNCLKAYHQTDNFITKNESVNAAVLLVTSLAVLKATRVSKNMFPTEIFTPKNATYVLGSTFLACMAENLSNKVESAIFSGGDSSRGNWKDKITSIFARVVLSTFLFYVVDNFGMKQKINTNIRTLVDLTFLVSSLGIGNGLPLKQYVPKPTAS